MHVPRDLGFSRPVLLLCVVLPVIVFVVRRKWRLSVARQEEIKRLLVLASEEAARAELEAKVSYGAVSVSRNSYQCAVCYSPTTTRCARCKAVRYCSGKCQIIHWRQGHKEECSPPSVTYHSNDDGSNASQKVAKEERYDIYDGRHENAPIKTSSEGHALSNIGSSQGVPHAKAEVKLGSVVDTEGTSSISESLDTGFSGFSTSPVGESMSSNDDPVDESINSSEPEASDGKISSDPIPDMVECGLKKVDHTKSLSPEFVTLIDSVDSFNKFSKLNESKSQSSGGQRQCTSAYTPVPSINTIHNDSVTRPVKVSSGFWDRSLDVDVTSNVVVDDPEIASSREATNITSQPFLHFKFDLSGGNVPSLNAQNSEIKGIRSDNVDQAVLDTGSAVDEPVLSEDTCDDIPKARRSTFLSCEKDSHMDVEPSDDSNVSKPTEPQYVPSSSSYAHLPSSSGGALHTVDSNVSKSNDLKSTSLGSNVSKIIVKDTVSASHLSKSRVSSSAFQTHSACRDNGHSVLSVKSGNVDNVEADAVTASPTISGLKSSMQKVVDQLRGPRCGKYNDKGLFSYDLFVKLYTSNKAEMRPCGLINCGNSCYANAVLQCLAFTPPLTAYFVQGLHSKQCVNKEWCFTCEFEHLVLKAKEGKSPLSPIGILSQLQRLGSQLGSGREEDAHEFLRYSIDAMQSVCLKEAGVNALGSCEEETTLIGLTFGGYLHSKIRCMKCHYKSERDERMMDLTVEIEGDIGKLEDALRRFTGTEILDGENKYQCSRCKSYERAKKRLKILEAPNVLTIALKRFQSGKFGKLNKSIRFPEILDLAPYMSGTSDKSPIYRLYGVVVHLDIMNASFSGHYVCYVKNIQNKWFKIDDSTVTPVELERVLTKGAYMLLYARCSPRAPRLIRNRVVSPDPRMKVSPSRIREKNTGLNSRPTTCRSSVDQLHRNSIPPDSLASVESFYLKFHRLQRILEEDSSSDNYSFTSSNSDEGSCSTESTRDSSSTDDLSDYIFGGWNNPWRNTSDSDTCSSSSSSPLYSRRSPERSRCQTDYADSGMEGGAWDRLPSGSIRLVGLEAEEGDPFLPSDGSKQCRKMDSSDSSYRETESGKLGRVNPVKSGVSIRRSMSKITD